MFWGAVGTYIDGIHEAFGVVAYPNPEWLGEKLPVSPAYLAATTGFFALYTLIVGHRPDSPQGYLGGEPVRVKDIVYALSSWLAIYVACGFLGAPARSNTFWPWVLGLGLLLAAAPTLWRERHTRFPYFALAVAVLGVSFEWSATAHGLFTYPICPSRACLDATVPLVWLPFLYVNAAVFMHRLLGGTHRFNTPSHRSPPTLRLVQKPEEPVLELQSRQ
jgi:hypothetical protein